MSFAPIAPINGPLPSGKVAMIVRDQSGRTVARRSLEQLRSKSTMYDRQIAEAQSAVTLYKSRVAKAEKQLQNFDSLITGEQLKQGLSNVENLSLPMADLLQFGKPLNFLEKREDIKKAIMRSKGLAQTRIPGLESSIAKLEGMRDSELKERSNALSQVESQINKENGLKDADGLATALRMQKEKALHDLDEENRLKAISEEQAKKKLAEDAINSQVKKEHDEQKENLMLKGYLQLPQTPLKTAVLKGLTRLQRAKFLSLEIQNEWANKKTELREALNQLVQAKLKIVNEQDRLSEETDDLFLEESDLLAELKIQNRIFSDKYVRVDAEFEELDGNLNAAKEIVAELERLQANESRGGETLRMGDTTRDGAPPPTANR